MLLPFLPARVLRERPVSARDGGGTGRRGGLKIRYADRALWVRIPLVAFGWSSRLLVKPPTEHKPHPRSRSEKARQVSGQ